MKPHHLAAVLAVCFATTATFADVSKKDQEFFTKAAAGGMYEVEAGKLAQARGTSEPVKSYGATLVKDHGMANDELKSLAAAKGAKLPATLPADKQKRLDKIGKARNFDKEFIDEVGLDDHKKDIGLFEKAAKDADDADVKAFAARTLPTLKAHREHAEGLKKAHGKY